MEGVNRQTRHGCIGSNGIREKGHEVISNTSGRRTMAPLHQYKYCDIDWKNADFDRQVDIELFFYKDCLHFSCVEGSSEARG